MPQLTIVSRTPFCSNTFGTAMLCAWQALTVSRTPLADLRIVNYSMPARPARHCSRMAADANRSEYTGSGGGNLWSGLTHLPSALPTVPSRGARSASSQSRAARCLPCSNNVLSVAHAVFGSNDSWSITLEKRQSTVVKRQVHQKLHLTNMSGVYDECCFGNKPWTHCCSDSNALCTEVLRKWTRSCCSAVRTSGRNFKLTTTEVSEVDVREFMQCYRSTYNFRSC